MLCLLFSKEKQITEDMVFQSSLVWHQALEGITGVEWELQRSWGPLHRSAKQAAFCLSWFLNIFNAVAPKDW